MCAYGKQNKFLSYFSGFKGFFISPKNVMKRVLQMEKQRENEITIANIVWCENPGIHRGMAVNIWTFVMSQRRSGCHLRKRPRYLSNASSNLLFLETFLDCDYYFGGRNIYVGGRQMSIILTRPPYDCTKKLFKLKYKNGGKQCANPWHSFFFRWSESLYSLFVINFKILKFVFSLSCFRSFCSRWPSVIILKKSTFHQMRPVLLGTIIQYYSHEILLKTRLIPLQNP